mmetsp:Transcript_128357/g.256374  ORF Transcript_128357/g.256374 Transcript_128357/m.256374 type:complete len:317 (+) Transcript_128357:88-1038(+)
MVALSVLRSTAAASIAAALLRLPQLASTSLLSRVALCLFAAYLPSYLDRSEHGPARRRSSAFSRSFRALCHKLLPAFFDVRPFLIEDPDKLSACKQYILAVHPHGVLSLDHVLTIAGFDAGFERVAPQARRSALSASVLFKIPVVREVELATGCVDAARRTASQCLNAGLCLSVVPGGEREQLLAQRGSIEHLVLRRRQGFVRLALQHGVPLVPLYCFGEAQLYYQSQFLMGFRAWLQRKLGVALVMPFGPYGLPGVPFRAPLRPVVGAPLEMPHIPTPSQAEVDEHHARYMAALEQLFEKHKHDAGYGAVNLELL